MRKTLRRSGFRQSDGAGNSGPISGGTPIGNPPGPPKNFRAPRPVDGFVVGRASFRALFGDLALGPMGKSGIRPVNVDFGALGPRLWGRVTYQNDRLGPRSKNQPPSSL